MKTDLGKRRYDLIPPRALSAVADVFTHGTKHDKPGARTPGFMNLKGATRLYTASLFRHWEAWRGGQRTDPDSGLPHLAHVASNAIILLALELRATKEGTDHVRKE